MTKQLYRVTVETPNLRMPYFVVAESEESARRNLLNRLGSSAKIVRCAYLGEQLSNVLFCGGTTVKHKCRLKLSKIRTKDGN